jgi:hypothetical protein
MALASASAVTVLPALVMLVRPRFVVPAAVDDPRDVATQPVAARG